MCVLQCQTAVAKTSQKTKPKAVERKKAVCELSVERMLKVTHTHTQQSRKKICSKGEYNNKTGDYDSAHTYTQNNDILVLWEHARMAINGKRRESMECLGYK